MTISSLIVRARPDHCQGVRAALEAIPGVEVRMTTPKGQLIVVADHDDAGAAADAYVAMNKIEGVLAVSLVYEFTNDCESHPER